MSRIRAYKMTHATGFAPNPFDGCMTLACCKPLMRNGKAVEKDDWIIGVGTKALGSGDINNPDEAKYENKIIYVMKVQKLVPWTEYYSTCIEKWSKFKTVPIRRHRSRHLRGLYLPVER